MVRFEAVSKHFPDGTRALKAVSLAVPKGEFCVVLGPAGAGKSTLLRMLNGLTEPSAGEFYLAGERVTGRNLRSVQKRVAMIHQSFHLVQRLPVISNVLSGMLPAISTPRALLGVFPAETQRQAGLPLRRRASSASSIPTRSGSPEQGGDCRVGQEPKGQKGAQGAAEPHDQKGTLHPGGEKDPPVDGQGKDREEKDRTGGGSRPQHRKSHGILLQKLAFSRLIKHAQMQGARNPEE